MYLQTENKSANGKGYAESDGQKMFAVNRIAFFQKAVKNGKKRKRDSSDHCAERRAEQRTEQKNYHAARAARHHAPEHSDKRKQ